MIVIRKLVFKGAALVSLMMAIWLIWSYPLWQVLLAFFMTGYAVLLWKFPASWLFVVPALLPVFDLAPWTGRFFFDEFDGIILVTLAVRYWNWGDHSAPDHQDRPVRALCLFVGLSVLISCFAGLWPFPPLDGNSFCSYLSHYNALRVFKGFLWAFLLLPLLKRDLRDAMVLKRLFIPGMLVGLAGASLAVLWERQLFSGLFNFENDFRVVGTFSGMHTGGACIDAYLASSLPFVAGCFLLWKNRLVWICGGGLFVVGSYALFVTYSRIDYLAYGVSFFLLLLGILSARVSVKKLSVILVVSGLVAVVIVVPVVRGAFMQKRFSTLTADIDLRLGHWREALRIMDPDPLTLLFGMGLGSYPRVYALRSTENERPSDYQFKFESGNGFLRLPSNGYLYLDQRIALKPNRSYLLKLDLRSADKTSRLAVPVCEKNLLHSFRYQWLVEEPGNTKGQWVPFEQRFESGLVGVGHFLYQRRPVVLSLLNERAGTTVDIDNLQLLADDGSNLLRNGDFSSGHDFWYFTADNHLPWHIKNLFAHLIFEQGWVGLSLCLFLLLFTLKALLVKVFQRHLLSILILSSLGGLFTVGLIDSLLDFPRITLLLFLLLALPWCQSEADPEGGDATT